MYVMCVMCVMCVADYSRLSQLLSIPMGRVQYNAMQYNTIQYTHQAMVQYLQSVNHSATSIHMYVLVGSTTTITVSYHCIHSISAARGLPCCVGGNHVDNGAIPDLQLLKYHLIVPSGHMAASELKWPLACVSHLASE